MKSHTVPKKLLEQFAFEDARTRSKRLWCYEKGISPYLVAPKSATRWDGHFSDPANSTREAEMELQLKREFEDPVNKFIEMLRYRTFVIGAVHVRALTGYITILFNRSRARRAATNLQRDNQIGALRALLKDDEMLAQLAIKETVDMFARGVHVVVTKDILKEVIQKQIEKHSGGEQTQALYVQTMETMMAYRDENMLNGEWRIIYTDASDPFVIGDAPVVTWERLPNNGLLFGQGFRRPDVEVLLPVAPTACLQVLPRVERNRSVRIPNVKEVNMAQAAFATRQCFSLVRRDELDAVLQPQFGMCRLGVDGFALRNVDYKKKLFEILMNQK